MKHQLLKKVTQRILFGFVFILFVGCNQHSMSNDSMEASPIKGIATSNNEKSSNVNEPKDLKIIKSARSRYKVKNVKMTTAKIKAFAKHYKGYISGLQFRNNLHSIENNFTIKVPQKYFDVLMDSIHNSVEFIEFENITTKDITEEYIDLETRLKTKTEIKERYEIILRKKAKTVEDILLTEEKLRIIQEEIEATLGRLKYLQDKVSYSTIQLDLYETVNYTPEPETYNKGFGTKIKEGFYNGWSIISTILLGIINIWPLLLIGFVLFFFIRKRRNRKALVN